MIPANNFLNVFLNQPLVLFIFLCAKLWHHRFLLSYRHSHVWISEVFRIWDWQISPLPLPPRPLLLPYHSFPSLLVEDGAAKSSYGVWGSIVGSAPVCSSLLSPAAGWVPGLIVSSLQWLSLHVDYKFNSPIAMVHCFVEYQYWYMLVICLQFSGDGML